LLLLRPKLSNNSINKLVITLSVITSVIIKKYMKKLTIGVFDSREDAEKAINKIHSELDVEHEDISYLYRDTMGEVKEVDSADVSGSTTTEGAKKGAKVGGTIGALAGLAVVAGVIPGVGPLLVAGPLASLLGLTGAVGSAAAGAAVGAAAGGLVGALVNWGVPKEKAKTYSDRVSAGNILVTVTAEDDIGVTRIMNECGADDVDTFSPAV
jgi:uncharacterized membrane protein